MHEQKTFAERFPFLNVDVLEARIRWSINLRWLATIGYFLATLCAFYFLEINIYYKAVWSLLGGLAFINFLYYIVLKLWKNFSISVEVFLLHIHILLDLIFLALIIHYSGGIENPAFLFFIFHVVLSSILFSRLTAALYGLLIICLFSTILLLEGTGIVTHYIVFDPHTFNNPIFVLFTIFIFAITVLSTTYICTGFMKIYRESKRIIDKQNLRLIEADKQKTSFFQFASHELKSPIIAIKSTLDVVLKGYSGNTDPKALHLLQRATHRSEQMLNMLAELLDLTHIRNKSAKAPFENVDIHSIIGDIIEQESALLDQKQIKTDLDLQAENPYIYSVKEDMEKIFSNLISNAIRYGKDNGQLSVHSSIYEGALHLSIEDDGIGIDRVDFENIFQEFFRSQNAKKTVNFGTGLGLSLVRQLVEKYKGKISVKSKQGRGSTFSLSFPQNRSLA